MVIVGGREGLLVWVKYFAPGMVMDLGAAMSRERLDDPVVGAARGCGSERREARPRASS